VSSCDFWGPDAFLIGLMVGMVLGTVTHTCVQIVMERRR
jgi:hypothetical protein